MQNTIVLSTETKNIEATINLPASKSISNRILIIQSLCDKKFEIENLSTADDTITLQKLLRSKETVLNAGEGGTTFRFLLAHLALRGKPVILSGSERMLQRPIQPMVEALNKLGANIEYVNQIGFPPLKINKAKLQGGEIEMDASISSQFITALLLIAPYLENGLTINLKGKEVSSSYTEMTIALMKDFGADVQRNENVITVFNKNYKPKDFSVEADWSAASYWYAMATLADDANILLPKLFQNSLQGDTIISTIMKNFSIETHFENNGVRIIKNKSALPDCFEYDFINCPDLFQTICVVGAALNIPSRFTGLHTLQHKETNRLTAMENELTKMGAVVKCNADSFELVKGINLNAAASISTYNDHRMAMAFAPLALKMKSVTIQNPEVVSKSYPDFWTDIGSLLRTSNE